MRLLFLAVLFSLLLSDARAQSGTAGSHLQNHSSPGRVVNLARDDVVKRIRKLMMEGQHAAALDLAEVHVRNMSDQGQRLPRYYAYNALCTVYSGLGRLEEAASACSRAISYNPSGWSAFNNRGTVHLLARRYELALADYEQALALAEAVNEGIVGAVLHNISLARSLQSVP